MANEYLRKIILEEIQKVLEEADYTDIAGSAPGQTYTPVPQTGPSGMTPKQMSYGSPEISKPKPRLDVKRLQQDLNATGKFKVAATGFLTPETVKAVRQAVGWRSSSNSILNNISNIRGQLKGMIASYKREMADKAVGAAGEMGYAKPALAGDLSGGSDSSAHPAITPGSESPLRKDVLTPEERQELMKVKPLNINKESIVRELKKLLKNI